MRIWIDPDEVSYQIGEKGTVSILYAKKGAQVEYGADIVAAAQQQVKNRNKKLQNDLVVFN